MSRVRFLVALCLAVLWLPATVHCGLEAAEIVAGCCESDRGGCTETESGCTVDACATLEQGGYRAEGTTLTVWAPESDWADLSRLLELALALPPAVSPLPETRPDSPREWLTRWVFERRAAALAQAPTV